MTDETSDITSELTTLIEPGHRERLLARGLARGLIWENGRLPPEAPEFSKSLTTDLLDHGFHILGLALRLRQLSSTEPIISRALRVGGEAIESAVRRGRVKNRQRGFNLTMAAAAFHIGGYAARAYSLLGGDLPGLNLSSPETTLAALMRRDLKCLRRISGGWLQAEEHSDKIVVTRLANGSSFGVDDAVYLSLTGVFHRAIANFEFALTSGDADYVREAVALLQLGLNASGRARHVPLWWAFRVAEHLIDDLWDHTLHMRLPIPPADDNWAELRRRFITLVTCRSIAEIDLWPSQLEAATRVIDRNDDLVVALPTSSGKTRIAELCILRCLADQKRIIYVTPLRALSAQVEAGLARTFRPLGYSVSAVYGASGIAIADVDTLRSSDIVVATPEKLDFAIRQAPTLLDDVGLIVLDEGHMIGFGEREIRYEMLVQRLLRRDDSETRRIVCLSAIFTDGPAFDAFTAWLRSDDPGTAIRSTWRPTRQRPGIIQWSGDSARLALEVEGERPFVPRFITPQEPSRGNRKRVFPASDQELVIASAREFRKRGHTVLVYCPQRRSVESLAKQFLLAHKQGFFESQLNDPAIITDAQRVGAEWLGKDHPAVACLKLGVAVHHGALPRPFLGEIENLLKRRQLPVAVSSPTLAQGVDLSFGVLILRSLIRSHNNPIPPKEFANVIGRVGRAFVDLDGLYVLPVWDPKRARASRAAFARLITESRQRTLESGVLLLLRVLVTLLQEAIGCSIEQLTEYVLNQANDWPHEKEGDENGLDLVLAELDTAILGIVDSLECEPSEVADRLDDALASSYWKRRLAAQPLELQKAQAAILRSRAIWVWSNTTVAKRRGYFTAGVGVETGRHIEEHAEALREALARAEEALRTDVVETAASATMELAEILFAVHPFTPESGPPGNWRELLRDWLRGRALSEFADGNGIRFVQNDVVYRLVWAVEAARVQLHALSEEDGDPPGGELALCLTFGTPNVEAALLIQSGLRSRVVATTAVALGHADFSDVEGMQEWLAGYLSGETEPIEWPEEGQATEWDEFLSSWRHPIDRPWAYSERRIEVEWFDATQPGAGTIVRICNEEGGTLICSPEFCPLGRVAGPAMGQGHVCTARVLRGGRVAILVFGPST